VALYQSLTSADALKFLNYSSEDRFKHTNLLQTDGGPKFKAEFSQNVFRYADRLRRARPYKKNEQSFIECFNRTLRKEKSAWVGVCIVKKDIPTLQTELYNYPNYYHTKGVHLGLNLKTPNQLLNEYLVSDI
jgi:transposase InsO family protein